MNQRLARALGVAALSIVATGLFIPRATAQSAPNLAPGVGCERFQCSNNTNDTYRIEWDAMCFDPGTDEPRTVVPTRNWIPPHGHIFMDVECPFERLLGPWGEDPDGRFRHPRKHHDDLVQGVVVDAYYKAALVDNPAPAPRPPTGSAG